jgi:hypothetical protein
MTAWPYGWLSPDRCRFVRAGRAGQGPGGARPRSGGFPFDDDTGASLAWRRPIDDWFVRLAEEVRLEVGFRLEAIGWEADGFVTAEANVYQPRDRPYGLVLADGTYLPAAG